MRRLATRGAFGPGAASLAVGGAGAAFAAAPAVAPQRLVTRGAFGPGAPSLVTRGTGPSSAPAVPAADFWTALVAWFLADADLAAAFPGGVVVGDAATRQPYPYARFWDAEDQEPVSPEDMEARLLASSYGADSADAGGDVLAVNAGQLLAHKLTADPDRPALAFNFMGAAWREVGFLWSTPTKLRQLPDGRDGVNLWRYDLTFKGFMVLAGSDS